MPRAGETVALMRAARSVDGGLTSNSTLMIVAIVGTTVAPWQMFFQQSNVIDKRITPRWLDYEKADTVLGAFVVVIGAAAIMMATASAFFGTAEFGHYRDALHVAQGLHTNLSPAAGAIFALLLFDASIVGASAGRGPIQRITGEIRGLKRKSLIEAFQPRQDLVFFRGAWEGESKGNKTEQQPDVISHLCLLRSAVSHAIEFNGE